MTKQLKITYDPDADVMSWEVPGKNIIDHATEMGNLVVHFTKTGKPVLIELLNASGVSGRNPAPFKRMLSQKGVNA